MVERGFPGLPGIPARSGFAGADWNLTLDLPEDDMSNDDENPFEITGEEFDEHVGKIRQDGEGDFTEEELNLYEQRIQRFKPDLIEAWPDIMAVLNTFYDIDEMSKEQRFVHVFQNLTEVVQVKDQMIDLLSQKEIVRHLLDVSHEQARWLVQETETAESMAEKIAKDLGAMPPGFARG